MTEERAMPSDFQREPRAATVDRDLQVLRQHPSAVEEWPPDSRVSLLSGTIPGIPSVDAVFHQIAAQPKEGRQLALLTVHVSPVTRLEQTVGWAAFDRAVESISQLLLTFKRDHLRREDLLGGLSISGTAFVFVLSPARSGQLIDCHVLFSLRERLQRHMAELVTERFPVDLAREFESFIGCAVITLDGESAIPRVLHRGLEAAYADAFGQRNRNLQRQRAALQAVIEQRRISMAVQPIVDLAAGKAIAYEALARCPDPDFTNTARLFEVASETGLLRPLERLCWETAAGRIRFLPNDALLFVNMEVESLLDPRNDVTALKQLGNRGVLELTERAAVTDYHLFRRGLNVFTEMGLRVAIDDVGSGHSGLRVIAETHPAFIKLDMGLTRGIEHDEIKWELVQLLRKFANRLSASLIVEGVETARELRMLRDIGVRYAQGYVFGRPAAELSEFDVSRVLTGLGPTDQGTLDRRIRSIAADLMAVENEVLEGEHTPQGLNDFKLALDHARTSVWAAVSPAEPQYQHRVISHFRLRRMTDMCRGVLADLNDGTITAASPDFEDFCAAVAPVMRQAAE